ncbi:MAG: phage baseplate assembly protein [Salinimicrobium sediminis]|nr:phage baseplate assembly protein [Salinimicrobium sediminis]
MIEELSRLLSPIKRCISIILTFGIVSKLQKNSEGELQTVQIDMGNDQIIDGVRRIQPFGLASSPVDADSNGGPETVLFSVGGNRDQPIIIQIDDSRYRVIVEKGNVTLYNAFGMCVHLKGEEVLLAQGDGSTLVPLDGVMTGQAIDSFLGIPMGSLPGGNSLGTANSQKLKVEL